MNGSDLSCDGAGVMPAMKMFAQFIPQEILKTGFAAVHLLQL
jgi:hypothetical protein